MSFEALIRERRAEGLADQLSLPVWKLNSQRCKSALAGLSSAFAAARIDVALIVGNVNERSSAKICSPRLLFLRAMPS